MAVGKSGRNKNWPKGKGFPKTWVEWDELSDDGLIKVLASMAARREIEES